MQGLMGEPQLVGPGVLHRRHTRPQALTGAIRRESPASYLDVTESLLLTVFLDDRGRYRDAVESDPLEAPGTPRWTIVRVDGPGGSVVGNV